MDNLIVQIILGICIFFGGSFVCLLLSYPLYAIVKLVIVIIKAKQFKTISNIESISMLVGFAERARREGILALEGSLDEIDDRFSRKGMRHVIDGVESELIKDILQTELAFIEDRHRFYQRMLTNLGNISLSIGIITMLINLVIVLFSATDTSALIPGIATALLGVLYGMFFAFFIFYPLSTKLTCRSSDEVMNKEIIIEGVMSIQSGDNPRILEDKLLAFIAPEQRPYDEDD